MNAQQAEVLNVTQQVLRAIVVSLGALNAQAMPMFIHALRAAATGGHLEPEARKMLGDLAEGVELLTGTGADRTH